MTVRLHTGDPSIYGAIREQMDCLREKNIAFDVVPGVSSFCGAAAALNLEYTLPDVSQTVIITRMAGRTPVPEKEEISLLASHRATMVIFLSTGMLEELRDRLIDGGYPSGTPAAIVYKASWPDEQKFVTTLSDLPALAKRENITKTALVIVGDVWDAIMNVPSCTIRRLYARIPYSEKILKKRKKMKIAMVAFTANGTLLEKKIQSCPAETRA
jgi:precorrin-4/cobalt-precorrin-4 C11-methyltransferase